MKNWYNRIKRIRMELLILALMGAAIWWFEWFYLSPLNTESVFFKILLMAMAIVFVHVSRQLLFPDLGVWRLLTDQVPELRGDTARAIVIAAILLMFSILVLAFMLGI